MMGTGKGGSGTVESFWTVQRSAQPAKPSLCPGVPPCLHSRVRHASFSPPSVASVCPVIGTSKHKKVIIICFPIRIFFSFGELSVVCYVHSLLDGNRIEKKIKRVRREEKGGTSDLGAPARTNTREGGLGDVAMEGEELIRRPRPLRNTCRMTQGRRGPPPPPDPLLPSQGPPRASPLSIFPLIPESSPSAPSPQHT